MISKQYQHYMITGLWILAAILLLCRPAYTDVRIAMTAVSGLPVGPDTAAIVSAIQRTALRPPQDVWERALLAAGARSFESVLSVPVGDFVGMETIKRPGGDVLVAQWQPGQSADAGVRGFSIWDTAYHNWFVVKCDAAKFASMNSAETFLKLLLKWNRMPMPLDVELRFAPPAVPTVLVGMAILPDAYRGATYDLLGVRHESEVYLLIRVGKAWFRSDYPEGGAYVPERFPPLRELVGSWSKGQILAEIGKTLLGRNPMAYNNARDAILIAAAAQRGLDRSDFEALLLPTSVPDIGAMEIRANAVMRALIDSRQLEHNREVFEDIALRLGSRREAGSFALHAVFLALEDSAVDSDYSDLALKCLNTCISPDAPLLYLGKRGNGEVVLAKVKQAVVPERSEGMRRHALEQIRARIDKGKTAR